MKIKDKISKYFKNIAHPTFNSLLNLIMLVVAIYAVIIANRTLEKADEQFKQNSKSSDSLFNVQLQYSKQLNDSLVYQISKLQEITNNQLGITNEQLIISKETYRSQLFASRPQITLVTNEIKDTNYVDIEIFSPVIITKYSNVGKRTALGLIVRTFIVYSDLSGIRPEAKYITLSENLEPDAASQHQFKPKIPVEYKDDFFYCVDIKYYDDILNEFFIQSYYFHYHRNREVFSFFNCEDNFKPKLKTLINKSLSYHKDRLFDI